MAIFPQFYLILCFSVRVKLFGKSISLARNALLALIKEIKILRFCSIFLCSACIAYLRALKYVTASSSNRTGAPFRPLVVAPEHPSALCQRLHWKLIADHKFVLWSTYQNALTA